MGIVKSRVLFLYPFHEFAYLFIFQQPLGRVVILGKFAFAEYRMNFIMANTVHSNGLPAAVGTGYQMMLVDRRTLNQFATAERAGFHRAIVAFARQARCQVVVGLRQVDEIPTRMKQVHVKADIAPACQPSSVTTPQACSPSFYAAGFRLTKKSVAPTAIRTPPKNMFCFLIAAESRK